MGICLAYDQIHRAFVTLFLTMTVLFAPLSFSYASPSCHDLLFGSLKPDFPHTGFYNMVVPTANVIRNQCGLSTCHLQAWASQLEQAYLLRNGHPLEISSDYWAAKHWLSLSLKALNRENLKDPNVNIHLESTMVSSANAISEYGILPASQWKGGNLYKSGEVSARLNSYIRNIVARTKWAAKNEQNEKFQNNLLEEGRRQIRDVFLNLIGPIPDTFIFNGRRYTTEEFSFQYFPDLQRPTVEMMVNQNSKGRSEFTELESKNHLLVKTSVDFVERTAKSLIDHGVSVYFIYDHDPDYVDMRSGIMSISAFHAPPWAAPLSHEQKDHFHLSPRGHIVQIVGYQENPNTGQIIKWKILNSWGKESGDHGYFHMYSDYFRANALSIGFYRDLRIPLPIPPH